MARIVGGPSRVIGCVISECIVASAGAIGDAVGAEAVTYGDGVAVIFQDL